MISIAKCRQPFAAIFGVLIFAASGLGDTRRGTDHVVIDGVKIPFGTIVEVSGPNRRDPDQQFGLFSFGAACIRGIRLDGRPIQDEIDFLLVPSDERGAPSYQNLAALKAGAFFKARGRIVDAVCSGKKNQIALVITHIEGTRPAPLTFADFVDRQARFEGTATSIVNVVVGSESIRLDGLAAWPPGVLGKRVGIRGVVRGGPGNWSIEKSEWNLIDLADQVGQDVALEGNLWSLNDYWYFRYRSEKLYLTDETGSVMKFSSDDFARKARVQGRLARQLRPSLEQISDKIDRDLVVCFVVRGAKVTYLEEAVPWPRMFGPLYQTFHTSSAGVPELLPESGYRKNVVGNETTTRLYIERNRDVIASILRGVTPATLEVLARRMKSEQLLKPLRLIYATMLARVNDERGQAFLLECLAAEPQSTDVFYCLGAFASLAPELSQIKTQTRWAEKALIGLMANRKPVRLDETATDSQPKTVADAAAHYSDIPSVLMQSESNEARHALVEYVLAGGSETAEVIEVLCNTKAVLPVEDLLKLERVTKSQKDHPVNVRNRRSLLTQLLRNKHRAAAERFVHDLEDGFVYMTFRDGSSPEAIAALRPLISAMTGESKNHAQMLVTLSAPDPVPAVIALLEDASWKDKNLALYELARLHDARAVLPVARVLRSAPAGYFNVASELNGHMTATIAVQHGLEAIAEARTGAAIDQLIELLTVDLTRFGGYIDRAGFQRIVAAHLIELTGESFGVDAEAWKAWRAVHPEFPLKKS